MENSHSASYAAAGVDVTAGYEAVKRIKPMVESTYIPGVLGTLGGFGGMFAPDLAGMKRPVLVSGTDGVGTKLRLALLLNKHDTIGIDCVAMCVNDIICGGASPSSSWTTSPAARMIPCASPRSSPASPRAAASPSAPWWAARPPSTPASCPMRTMTWPVSRWVSWTRRRSIDGKRLSEGDALIGLASTGVHSNGFSLVRKVFDVEHADLNAPVDELGGKSLGETLLTPTRIYVKAVKALLKAGVDIHAISHITGGGFYENVPRMMTEGLTARIELSSFPRLPIFDLIQKKGNIPERDMYNTFNMGLGMLLAVPAGEAEKALEILRAAGESAYAVGSVVRGDAGVELV